MNERERTAVAQLVAAVSGRLIVEAATDLGEAELLRCLGDCAAPRLCIHIGRYMREGLQATVADLEQFAGGCGLPEDAPACVPFSQQHEAARCEVARLQSRVAFAVYRDALVAAAAGEPVYIGAAADELGPMLVRLAKVSDAGLGYHTATPLGCEVASMLELDQTDREFLLAEARWCADG